MPNSNEPLLNPLRSGGQRTRTRTSTTPVRNAPTFDPDKEDRINAILQSRPGARLSRAIVNFVNSTVRPRGEEVLKALQTLWEQGQSTIESRRGQSIPPSPRPRQPNIRKGGVIKRKPSTVSKVRKGGVIKRRKKK
jgi:hypothetical protein